MSNFPEKKRYEGVRFNVIHVTRGVGWCQFSRKKRYVTLECPLSPRQGCSGINIMRHNAVLYHVRYVFQRPGYSAGDPTVKHEEKCLHATRH